MDEYDVTADAERDALRARIAEAWDEGHLIGYDGPGFEEFEKSRGRNPYRRADQPEATPEPASSGHSCPPGEVEIKFDGGRVALLCTHCHTVVGYGRDLV